MSAVWVVRDADGYPRGVSMWRWSAIDDAYFGGDDLAMEELSGGSDGPFNGFTVTRETLCTPAQAAVLEAAKALYIASAVERISVEDVQEKLATLFSTVENTLRAQEGES